MGGSGHDVLCGFGGNDTFDGGSGNDTIEGGAGDDAHDGGSGNDALHGGVGDDAHTGGSGHDTLDGGTGTDVHDGGSGSDTLQNGETTDEGSGTDAVIPDDGGVGEPPPGGENPNCATARSYDWTTEQPSLAGLDLSHCNLTGANLESATLAGANLTGADLTLANLTGITLNSANLRYADLTGATALTRESVANVIWGTTICPDGTNSDANSGTCSNNLNGYCVTARSYNYETNRINLAGIDLTHCDLSGANLSDTNLTSIDLNGATGLTPEAVMNVIWSHSTCPDGTNSDDNGGTCEGHLIF